MRLKPSLDESDTGASLTGGPEVLKLEDIPVPAPDPNEVLVKVAAAGVGPWDALVRTGKSGVAQTLPLTPGSDIAGVVDRVGSNVTAFAVGDTVFGCTNAFFVNGYAEFARAEAGMIAAAPTSISAVEAASVPVVAVMAWDMLFTHAVDLFMSRRSRADSGRVWERRRICRAARTKCRCPGAYRR